MTDFLNSYDVQPDELTISEVAKILRCSRQMVLKICHKYKDLPYYKVGKRYLIPKLLPQTVMYGTCNSQKECPGKDCRKCPSLIKCKEDDCTN